MSAQSANEAADDQPQATESILSAQDADDDTLQTFEEDIDRGIIVHAGDMAPDGFPASKKRKKRSKKPASKRGLGKPTGFEEYHADGPLTPEQYRESREVFHPDVPFVDRILRAIQRFERTRKLTPERRDIFYKYLAYGGVDVGPNMFAGAQDTRDMDKDNVNATLAQANITEDTKQSILDPKQVEDDDSVAAGMAESGNRLRSSEHLAKYVVDFEGTMRGFFSRHAPGIYHFDTPGNVDLVTTTLERFMDYLLQHEVCSEYAIEVMRTRNLCRTAKTELWHCAEAQRHLPDDFNIACSTLFGGSYARNYDGETAWGLDNAEGNVFVGLKPERATQIVGFAIAGAASEEVYTKYLDITTGETEGRGFEVINTIRDHGFEITKLEPPTKECLNLYKENTTEFRPVGRITAKFFENPNAPPEDLTPRERALVNSKSARSNEGDTNHRNQFVFFLESKPLFSFLQPGMRIEATIHELNCGVWFFDEVVRVLPSFDLWLENELMLGWKEPKPMAGISSTIWNVGGTTAKAEQTEHESDQPHKLDTLNDLEERTSQLAVRSDNDQEDDGANRDIGDGVQQTKQHEATEIVRNLLDEDGTPY